MLIKEGAASNSLEEHNGNWLEMNIAIRHGIFYMARLSNSLWDGRSRNYFLEINRLDIIGGEHAVFSRSVNCSCHPAFIDWIAIDNHISVFERDLIHVLSFVIIHSLETSPSN